MNRRFVNIVGLAALMAVAGITAHAQPVARGIAGNGWGLGWIVVRRPQGPTALLSRGTFGHSGAYGTQAWVDPVKQRIYVLMVQRSNFPTSADSTGVCLAFLAAATAKP